MAIHTMSQLLVVFLVVPVMIYSHSIPEGWHKPRQNSTDSHVQLALKAINELFRNNGDSKERSVERILSKTIEASTEVIYRYEIAVSGGSTKELCNVTILSRSSTTGEDNEIKLAGPTQCSSQEEAYDPHIKAPSRRRRSDLAYIDALDFLEREMTVLTNSSRYLLYKTPSRYLYAKDKMVILNIEFAKGRCTLAYMDETHDYWGLCYIDSNKVPTAVKCKYVELLFTGFREPFKILKHDCLKTRFFDE